MFIDSRKISVNDTIETDVCIVGAGVAGIALAKEFEHQGVRIAIVESGGLRPDKKTQSLYWGENAGIPYYPLDTARARFFGGTSHFWHIKLPNKRMGVRLRPMDAIDFEHKAWIPYSGWPFEREELVPYYERAQRVCQIGPFNYDPVFWADDQRRPLEIAGPGAQTTMFQFGDREVFFKTYAHDLEKAARITVYLHGNVTAIETTENAAAVSRLRVACLDGPRYFVKAKYYIIALGGIETPRLLLLSRATCQQGLGNQHDLVGRFFMEHPHLWSGIFIPSSLQVSNATGLYQIFCRESTPVIGKFALTEKALRQEKLANWCASIHPDFQLSRQLYMQHDKSGVAALRSLKRRIGGKASQTSVWRDFGNVLSDPKSIGLAAARKIWGGVHKEFERSGHKAAFRLNHMVEQTPNPDSRVSLIDECDALGQQRVKLDWRLNPIDIRTITRAQEILDREMRDAGLGHLEIETRADQLPPKIHGGWHHMGTTRMHADPRHGVVDADCRLHGTANLFIAGASTFPTVGYANPVLTTVALVLRLGDHLKRLLR